MIQVHLRCPGCGYVWHFATIDPAAWWAVSPESVAEQPFCPQCDHAPPMGVVSELPLLEGIA